jgi:hypothetical protein
VIFFVKNAIPGFVNPLAAYNIWLWNAMGRHSEFYEKLADGIRIGSGTVF